MPVLSPAFKINCQSCGWSKTFSPVSDCRVQGWIPEECPVCGGSNLYHVKANMFERMAVKIKDAIKLKN